MDSTPHESSPCADDVDRVDSRPQRAASLEQLAVEVSHSAATHRNLQDLLCDLVMLLQRAVSFDRLGLVLHEPAGDVMRLHSIAALHPLTPSCVETPIGESPAGLVWQTQEPLIVPSVARENRFPAITKILTAQGLKSFCVLPLTSPIRRLGGLSFSSLDEDAFDEEHVELLGKLTTPIALAVDNVLHHEAAERAHGELSRERDRLQLLLEVNNALVSNLEPQGLLRAVAACLRRVVHHEYTSLSVYDEERRAFDMWALEFDGKGLIKEHMTVPLEGSPAGLAFRSRRPARLDAADLGRLSGEIAKLLLAEGIRALCSVPLVVRDRCLGTLNFGRVEEGSFSPQDAELLATIANQVAFTVENALAFQQIAALKDKLAAEKVYLEEEIRTDYNFEEIIGDSPALRIALRQVETVAPNDTTVLIYGETGTGKELIARAIHQLSQRRERTLVKVNCAAIPTGLLESELFGHERGAFTGAIAQKIGRFELADRGTLFLDEVGDIPLELQPKLLRVLQEREFERLGSTRTRRVDVRVVAATNRPLDEMVAAGAFRRDLYYRLNVFPITLPPLRERTDDIPRLVRYFVQKLARSMNKRIESVSVEAMEALERYSWPGNVRELENAIERAVILTSNGVLEVPSLEFPAGTVLAPRSGTLEATEREAIIRALRETRGVVSGPDGAASRLGLKRTTLQSRMRKLGISRAEA